MVYRRMNKRRFTKRRRYTRRTRYSRTTRYRKRGLRQPVQYFTRFVDRGTITYNSTPLADEQLIGIRFRLTDVPNYTEFTNLFDMYKLVAVKVMFIPISNVSLANPETLPINEPTPQTTNFFRFVSVIDYNDSTAPASLNDMRQYSTCKVTRNNRIHKRFLYPKVNAFIQQDGSTAATSGGSTNPWLTTSSPDINHYGLKFGFEQEPDSPGARYQLECKYYLKFKNQK